MTAYWIERFAPRLFVPAAALIALAAGAGSGLGAIEWGLTVVLSLLLLAQFRLWDDLADRDRDRAAHPDRVLVRAARVWPFVVTCTGLAVANLLLLLAWNGLAGMLAFLVLNAAAFAWYAWRPVIRTAAGDLVLLTKYPAFVFLIASPSAWSSPGVWIPALTIYAAACGFEIWHDAATPLRFTQ